MGPAGRGQREPRNHAEEVGDQEAPAKDRDDVNKMRRLSPPPPVPAERGATGTQKQQIPMVEKEADEDDAAGPAGDDFEPDWDPDDVNTAPST